MGSQALFDRAKAVISGGVNSPGRAFFLSTAHSSEDLRRILDAVRECVR